MQIKGQISAVQASSLNRIHRYILRIRDSYFVAYMVRHPLYSFGFAVTVGCGLLAIVGPYIIPYSPTVGVAGELLLPPSIRHWFGTDRNAMDIFSRTIAAFRTDLAIALSGVLIAMILGAPVGVFCGFFDGRTDGFGVISLLMMRVMDVFQAFPVFVLGLVLVAAFGPSWLNLILVIAVVNLPPFLRLARAEVLSLRDKAYVEAARASGNSDLRIAFAHLMPNSMTPVVALVSMLTGFGILLTAGISFVGAGVRVPTPEWGSMISIGAPQMVTGQWWSAVFPGFFMAATIFGFSLVGEAITALQDPLERLRMGYGR